MPTDAETLLPPNASALERAVAAAIARVSDVPVPFPELWSPEDCPAPLLPWLAWALSIDRWKADWSEERKRAEVASAIEQQRLKGTRGSLEDLLASFDPLIELVEWHETTPAGDPYTFAVTLPLDGLGGERSTAAFAAEVVRDINRIKPVRAHFTFWQAAAAAADLALRAAGQVAFFTRTQATLQELPGDWADYLSTEIGEPLQAPDGSFLEVT